MYRKYALPCNRKYTKAPRIGSLALAAWQTGAVHPMGCLHRHRWLDANGGGCIHKAGRQHHGRASSHKALADGRIVVVQAKGMEQVQAGIEHGSVGLIGAVESDCLDGQ